MFEVWVTIFKHVIKDSRPPHRAWLMITFSKSEVRDLILPTLNLGSENQVKYLDFVAIFWSVCQRSPNEELFHYVTTMTKRINIVVLRSIETNTNPGRSRRITRYSPLWNNSDILSGSRKPGQSSNPRKQVRRGMLIGKAPVVWEITISTGTIVRMREENRKKVVLKPTA